MSKEKIEEMAKIIADCEICIYHGDVVWKEEYVSDDLALCIARVLNEQDYRKASEVAREIFEEIEKFNRPPLPECEPVYIIKAREFVELKKKYAEVEG